MSDPLICDDCTARFEASRAGEHDADAHEAHTGHTVHAVDMSRHARDVRRSERLDRQAPRGKRERMIDHHGGKPRADY